MFVHKEAFKLIVVVTLMDFSFAYHLELFHPKINGPVNGYSRTGIVNEYIGN